MSRIPGNTLAIHLQHPNRTGSTFMNSFTVFPEWSQSKASRLQTLPSDGWEVTTLAISPIYYSPGSRDIAAVLKSTNRQIQWPHTLQYSILIQRPVFLTKISTVAPLCTQCVFQISAAQYSCQCLQAPGSCSAVNIYVNTIFVDISSTVAREQRPPTFSCFFCTVVFAVTLAPNK